MYSKITNPETDAQVSINSRLGKDVLRKYLIVLNGGSSARRKKKKKKKKKNKRAAPRAVALEAVPAADSTPYHCPPEFPRFCGPLGLGLTPPIASGPQTPMIGKTPADSFKNNRCARVLGDCFLQETEKKDEHTINGILTNLRPCVKGGESEQDAGTTDPCFNHEELRGRAAATKAAGVVVRSGVTTNYLMPDTLHKLMNDAFANISESIDVGTFDKEWGIDTHSADRENIEGRHLRQFATSGGHYHRLIHMISYTERGRELFSNTLNKCFYRSDESGTEISETESLNPPGFLKLTSTSQSEDRTIGNQAGFSLNEYDRHGNLTAHYHIYGPRFTYPEDGVQDEGVRAEIARISKEGPVVPDRFLSTDSGRHVQDSFSGSFSQFDTDFSGELAVERAKRLYSPLPMQYASKPHRTPIKFPKDPSTLWEDFDRDTLIEGKGVFIHWKQRGRRENADTFVSPESENWYCRRHRERGMVVPRSNLEIGIHVFLILDHFKNFLNTNQGEYGVAEEFESVVELGLGGKRRSMKPRRDPQKAKMLAAAQEATEIEMLRHLDEAVKGNLAENIRKDFLIENGPVVYQLDLNPFVLFSIYALLPFWSGPFETTKSFTKEDVESIDSFIALDDKGLFFDVMELVMKTQNSDRKPNISRLLKLTKEEATVAYINLKISKKKNHDTLNKCNSWINYILGRRGQNDIRSPIGTESQEDNILFRKLQEEKVDLLKKDLILGLRMDLIVFHIKITYLLPKTLRQKIHASGRLLRAASSQYTEIMKTMLELFIKSELGTVDAVEVEASTKWTEKPDEVPLATFLATELAKVSNDSTKVLSPPQHIESLIILLNRQFSTEETAARKAGGSIDTGVTRAQRSLSHPRDSTFDSSQPFVPREPVRPDYERMLSEAFDMGAEDKDAPPPLSKGVASRLQGERAARESMGREVQYAFKAEPAEVDIARTLQLEYPAAIARALKTLPPPPTGWVKIAAARDEAGENPYYSNPATRNIYWDGIMTGGYLCVAEGYSNLYNRVIATYPLPWPLPEFKFEGMESRVMPAISIGDWYTLDDDDGRWDGVRRVPPKEDSIEFWGNQLIFKDGTDTIEVHVRTFDSSRSNLKCENYHNRAEKLYKYTLNNNDHTYIKEEQDYPSFTGNGYVHAITPEELLEAIFSPTANVTDVDVEGTATIAPILQLTPFDQWREDYVHGLVTTELLPWENKFVKLFRNIAIMHLKNGGQGLNNDIKIQLLDVHPDTMLHVLTPTTVSLDVGKAKKRVMEVGALPDRISVSDANIWIHTQKDLFDTFKKGLYRHTYIENLVWGEESYNAAMSHLHNEEQDKRTKRTRDRTIQYDKEEAARLQQFESDRDFILREQIKSWCEKYFEASYRLLMINYQWQVNELVLIQWLKRKKEELSNAVKSRVLTEEQADTRLTNKVRTGRTANSRPLSQLSKLVYLENRELIGIRENWEDDEELISRKQLVGRRERWAGDQAAVDTSLMYLTELHLLRLIYLLSNEDVGALDITATRRSLEIQQESGRELLQNDEFYKSHGDYGVGS